jgi:hypothetical protein
VRFPSPQLAPRQEVLGPLNTAIGQIAVRRDAERLLERAAKMVWAELDQPGQEQQRDFVGKMLLDILRQLLSLPPGEPPMLVRFKRGAALVQPHQLVRQRDAEHFDIGALGLARMLQLRLELQDGCPDIGIEKKVWLELDSGKTKLGVRRRTLELSLGSH